jgi:halogenation protein CepH
MDTRNGYQFDAIIVGGGPGGSTAAAAVAMRGHRVLVLESEKFPRYQIGESLLPPTIHGVCRLIGVADDVARAGFVRKRGGTFKWGANPEPWTFSFSVSPKMAGPTSFAYQVERMKFDKILLDNARRAGAEVREQCTVTGVYEEDGRVCGVHYTDAAGEKHVVTARYTVDASGHKSRIYRSVGGTRKYSDFFRNIAIFGYFENGKRMPEPDSGNILCSAFDDGWFWYIPLTPTITSVGAVVDKESADKVQGDPDKMLHELIAQCPLIAEYLSDAKRITEGEYGKIRVRRDYSYHQTKFWRPGLALIGDAACFVDPIFSSGVHLATYSGLLAGRSINSSIEGLAGEEESFQEFEARYRREYGVFYKYLMSFYVMHAREDSYFWEAKKITGSTRSEMEAFVNLVGGLSSGEFDLAGGQSIAERVGSESAEFERAVRQLAGNKNETIVPLIKSSIVRQAMVEGEQMLRKAQLAGNGSSELPLFEGGLLSSPDGLAWAPSEVPEKLS